MPSRHRVPKRRGVCTYQKLEDIRYEGRTAVFPISLPLQKDGAPKTGKRFAVDLGIHDDRKDSSITVALEDSLSLHVVWSCGHVRGGSGSVLIWQESHRDVSMSEMKNAYTARGIDHQCLLPHRNVGIPGTN